MATLASRSGGPPPFRHATFVRVQGMDFAAGCRPFAWTGFNADNLPEAHQAAAEAQAHRERTEPLADAAGPRKWLGGAGLLTPARGGGAAWAAEGDAAVRRVMVGAQRAGLNVARVWAHSTNARRPLLVRPGVYDESVFRALDGVIAEAERAGLRVVLSLADHWKYSGGTAQMLDWSTTVEPRTAQFPPPGTGEGDADRSGWSAQRREYEDRRAAKFYVDSHAREIYREHARAVLLRRNAVTGRMYKDDPTILAFDLLNEPRCQTDAEPDCLARLDGWVREQALFFKSIDSRHLVTLGSEGFWGPEDPSAQFNPGQGWAAASGQDFVRNLMGSALDFGTVHVWPDNWAHNDTAFVARFLRQHVTDAQERARKPVVLEEFGKKLGRARDGGISRNGQDERAEAFASVLNLAEELHSPGSPFGGSLFWRWGFNAWAPQDAGEYGVVPTDRAFAVASRHAAGIQARVQRRAPLGFCEAPCWVAAQGWLGQRRCAQGSAKACQLGGARVWGSWDECCLPGLGAHKEGCSAWL